MISLSLVFVSIINTMFCARDSLWIDRECEGNACGLQFNVYGSLSDSIDEKFKRIYDSVKLTSYTPNEIVLNSPGGSLSGAMKLGRLIRDRKLTARTDFCMSSCVFAFAGGVTRYAQENTLGVHQFYGKDSGLSESSTQKISSILAVFLDEMGVSRKVLDIAFLMPKDSIHLLSESEISEYNFDNSRIKYGEWDITIDNRNNPSAAMMIQYPGGDISGLVNVFQVDRRLRLSLKLTSSDEFIGRLLLMGVTAVGENPIIRAYEKDVSQLENSIWMLHSEGLIFVAEFPESALQKIRLMPAIDIAFDVPRMLSDANPSFSLNLSGLRKKYPSLFAARY